MKYSTLMSWVGKERRANKHGGEKGSPSGHELGGSDAGAWGSGNGKD